MADVDHTTGGTASGHLGGSKGDGGGGGGGGRRPDKKKEVTKAHYAEVSFLRFIFSQSLSLRITKTCADLAILTKEKRRQEADDH